MDLVKGDNINLRITLAEDITNWKFRAELSDCTHSIKKASANSGGSTSQILITDESNGIFIVRITKDETVDFDKYGTIEVEVEDADGEVFTILQEQVTFLDQRVTWSDPSE